MKNRLPERARKLLNDHFPENHPETYVMYLKLWGNTTILRAQLAQWSESERKALARRPDKRDGWKKFAFDQFVKLYDSVIGDGEPARGGTKQIASEVKDKFDIEPSVKELNKVRRSAIADRRRMHSKKWR